MSEVKETEQVEASIAKVGTSIENSVESGKEKLTQTVDNVKTTFTSWYTSVVGAIFGNDVAELTEVLPDLWSMITTGDYDERAMAMELINELQKDAPHDLAMAGIAAIPVGGPVVVKLDSAIKKRLDNPRIKELIKKIQDKKREKVQTAGGRKKTKNINKVKLRIRKTLKAYHRTNRY
jgi:hypothetical protein